MSEEEIQRKIEFIIDQQAQFASDIHELRSIQAKAEERMDRFEKVVVNLYEDTQNKLDGLIDAQMRQSEAQSRTEESLRNLIAVVDRYFSDGRNDRS